MRRISRVAEEVSARLYIRDALAVDSLYSSSSRAALTLKSRCIMVST
jgi:hypothetical protein